ncbi:MAG: alpha/beta hydrolase [Polaromonas sp.]|uniref:alpha/beta fold hydrolase n=1 Tax=Polaromonas sp. TaxID=1869339 RepID=UPI002735F816|nr:alpha/beta hydrolase [Polaromonas sp.]MDP3799025.1 alpha/beta hydrolase [Polaromonas sp.]
MSTNQILNPQDAQAEIERIDKLAVKTHTDCGPAATMVWRRWGSGPNLVLIHGGAGSWMHWIRNVEVLAKTHTVWAPDTPGFGDSDLPGENLDAHTLFPYVLSGLREVLKGEEFDLVGFSFGGLIASLIAAERPDNLRRLVVVSVAAMGLFSENPVLRSMRGVTDPAERNEVFRSNLNALMLNDAGAVDDLAIAVQSWSASRERVKNRKLVLTDILLRLCHEWRCPAFGIWGRQDLLYRNQLEKLESVSGTLGMRERVVMEGAGHWLQYEKADEFNHTLQRLLDAPLGNEGGGKHGN